MSLIDDFVEAMLLLRHDGWHRNPGVNLVLLWLDGLKEKMLMEFFLLFTFINKFLLKSFAPSPLYQVFCAFLSKYCCLFVQLASVSLSSCCPTLCLHLLDE